jgi:hypothetical protein
MLLPRTLLDTMLFLGAVWLLVAPLALGALLPVVLIWPLPLLRVLRLLFLVGLPLLMGPLLPVVLVLSLLLLGVLSLLVLLLSLFLLGVLSLLVLLLSLLLLGVLLLLSPLWLLLLLLCLLLLSSMLLFRLGLLVLALLLCGMVLLFALLLMLCVNRSSESEKQRQKGCARDSNYLHKCYLHLVAAPVSQSSSPASKLGAEHRISLFIGAPPVPLMVKTAQCRRK